MREGFLQGSRNGLQLWRELQTQGYKGSPRAVYRFLAQLKQGSAATRGKTQRAQVAPDTSVSQWTAKQAVWWFIRDPSEWKKKEQETLLAIRQASPTVGRAYGLAQDFMGMLRHREGERLDVWLGQVRASHIPELQRFVRSIQQDKDAVLAGLDSTVEQWRRRGENQQIKAHQAHDVWPR